ncbi:MAG: ATP-binding protein [Candidatus Dependentiae bacterium]|nr:ATP-binding protein [Candidatus Dependentiae bacterium]
MQVQPKGRSRRLGTIVSGSLSDGFVMHLDPTHLEQIKSGRFVSIQGSEGAFFSLVTDIQLDTKNAELLLFPPTAEEELFGELVRTHYLSARAVLKPLVMLDRRGSVRPVKTVPAHFAPVFEASEEEIIAIFGEERAERSTHFAVGTPIDMSTPVCINLASFVERSSGIFGKTGTGKTFITRLLLAGLIRHERAVCVVFDMHNEYGLQARAEGGGGHFVKGLKTLFPEKVAIFSLDPESTLRRGVSPDLTVTIPYQAIHVQDIVSLYHELNLHPTACEAASLLAARFRQQWLAQLLASGDRLKELAADVGAHPESIAALYRKLRQIERLPCFVAQEQGGDQVIASMMEYLERGISVIVEFGTFASTFCYLLLANIITRHIHALYTAKTELFLGNRLPAYEPKKLLLVIEEAHKFLNPHAAAQTIFGTIAREMRKYYVSLLIIDQRPSGIESEVLSQIGTKIVAQLHDENDIAAVLGGVGNASQLKTVLSTLDSKKQVLLLGHAVALPIVVETRSYDETFYAQIAPPIEVDRLISQLF